MREIPATKFKAQCLDLMDRVAERRETYVITKRGKPVARLVPVPRMRKDTLFGCLRSRGSILGDIVNPVLPPESWDAFRKWDELIGAKKPAQGAPAVRKRKEIRR